MSMDCAVGVRLRIYLCECGALIAPKEEKKHIFLSDFV